MPRPQVQRWAYPCPEVGQVRCQQQIEQCSPTSRSSPRRLRLTSELRYHTSLPHERLMPCCRYDAPGLAVHYLLRLLPSREPIGTVRIVPTKMKIGRLCLHADYRKHGFGSDLMVKGQLHLGSYLAERGLGPSQIALHSQIPVVPFYAKCVERVHMMPPPPDLTLCTISFHVDWGMKPLERSSMKKALRIRRWS